MATMNSCLRNKLKSLTRELTAQEREVLDILEVKGEETTSNEHTLVYAVWCLHIRPADRDHREFMTADEIHACQDRKGDERRAHAQRQWDLTH